MNWSYEISYFFGGMFFANAIPHTVSGLMGKPFQSPFAKPPGEGFSSSIVNVLWGYANIVVGYGLLLQIGEFNLHSIPDAAAAGLGAFTISIFLARHFGKFNGGSLKIG